MPDNSTVVARDDRAGLVAFMIQHADGQKQLASYPNGAIRIRGDSFDELWPAFLARCLAAHEQEQEL